MNVGMCRDSQILFAVSVLVEAAEGQAGGELSADQVLEGMGEQEGFAFFGELSLFLLGEQLCFRLGKEVLQLQPPFTLISQRVEDELRGAAEPCDQRATGA